MSSSTLRIFVPICGFPETMTRPEVGLAIVMCIYVPSFAYDDLANTALLRKKLGFRARVIV